MLHACHAYEEASVQASCTVAWLAEATTPGAWGQAALLRGDLFVEGGVEAVFHGGDLAVAAGVAAALEVGAEPDLDDAFDDGLAEQVGGQTQDVGVVVSS